MKTISWRVVSTLPFAVLAFIVTGSLAASSQLIIADVVGRTALYVAHEWAWQHPAALASFKHFVSHSPQALASLLLHRPH